MTEAIRFCPTCGSSLEKTGEVNFGIIRYYTCSRENRFWRESRVSTREINLSEAKGPNLSAELDWRESHPRAEGLVARG